MLTRRERARQARRHFTQLDQVTQLVAVSETDADLGFMARMLALSSLPRANLGDQLQYVRRNGPLTLAMTAGVNNKLPYGNLPRLLLAWVCTEAVRTQRRELILGDSLSAFMRSVGVYNSGGAVRSRLQEQMRRLFTASSCDNRRKLLTVQRSGDSGSPRVAGSTSDSRSESSRGSSSTFFLRPPPLRRTRRMASQTDACSSWDRSSRTPLPIVEGARPMARCTLAMPPWPNATASEPGARLDAEFGYGFGALRDRSVLTPYGGLSLVGEAARGYRLGGRLAVGQSATVSLEAERRQYLAAARTHTLLLLGTL